MTYYWIGSFLGLVPSSVTCLLSRSASRKYYSTDRGSVTINSRVRSIIIVSVLRERSSFALSYYFMTQVVRSFHFGSRLIIIIQLRDTLLLSVNLLATGGFYRVGTSLLQLRCLSIPHSRSSEHLVDVLVLSIN